MKFINDRVSAFNLGDIFVSGSEQLELLNNERGVRYRDAAHIALPDGEAWIFDYGVIIFWAVTEDERMALLNRLQLENHQLHSDNQEHFRFVTGGSELRISQDKIVLADDDVLSRLAISHALAQSLKLNEYESQAQQTIQAYAHLPHALAETGKIKLSRQEIAKIRGNLFSTKSDIILHYELLDTPNFFWEYPEYEAIYNVAARYLEIHPRVEILSKKLSTIHELFGMLADEQKHQHSAFLEWIIIILIAIEIVMFGAQEIQAML
ncbi:RMD1 family protein [Neptunicella sp. SCSIO 80796]|uniref:RMD1 family protein n=1 Tax=Neptunicella plasticusilytica TaxID=3117012 RepID=UPI003A4DBEDA